MEHKVIADIERGNPLTRLIKSHTQDMMVETKGLLANIYHHAKEYDNCLFAGNEEDANIHYISFNTLGRIFNATVEENFTVEEKLCLIEKARNLCERMVKEAKHDKIKRIANSLRRMYTSTANHIILEYMNAKNAPRG